MKPQLPWLSVILLTVIDIVGRFVALETSPPGFHTDETALAAQIISVRETGHDFQGTPWPLVSPVMVSGYASTTYLYSGVMWSSLFGDSSVAYRSLAAFYGSMTVIGVFVLGRCLWGWRAGLIAAMACSLSPWAVQFSRIAWDPPLAPCFLVWSLYFVTSGKSPRLFGILGGICGALACYSYPPTRLHVPLLIPFILSYLWFYRRQTRRAFLPFAIAFAIVVFPLARLTITGEIQGRFQQLCILNPEWQKPWGGPSVAVTLFLFWDNLKANFTPGYLFFHGGQDSSYTIRAVGMWGATEILAFLVALVWLIKYLVKRPLFASNSPTQSTPVHWPTVWPVVLVIWGYVSAVIPAAITHCVFGSHALRSIGAFPFIALFAGFVIDRICKQRQWFLWIVLLLTASFTTWHFYQRLWVYPTWCVGWFDQQIIQAAAGATTEADLATRIRKVDPQYDDLRISYYRIRFNQRSRQNAHD